MLALVWMSGHTAAFARNAKYVLQVLCDNLGSLGSVITVNLTGMIRP